MNSMEGNYPQPHVGVAGIDRTGDPLMTTEGALVASEMMGLLYSALLVANPAPRVAEMFDRATNPSVGEAVVVLDSIYRSDPDAKNKGVGYLVAARSEWGTTDEEWEAARAEDGTLTDDDRWVEQSAWYVQYGPAPVDVCRWTNCQVLAIPRRHASRWGA